MTRAAALPSGAADWMAVWPEAERAVQRSVRGRLPVGVEPADVSQQVFVHLLRAGPSAPPPERLKFWAVAVARRVLADQYRRKAVPMQDLARAPVVDIEAIVLARLRCEVAAHAYAVLPAADRASLSDRAEGSAPVTNSLKLRRSRARRTLREKAARLVGGGILLPRWGWLAGTTGAAAIIVPLCLGLSAPGVDTGRDTTQGTPMAAHPGEVEIRTEGPAAEAAEVLPGTGTGSRSSLPQPPPAEPTYHRRISVSGPAGAAAGYDHYSPAPAAGAPPMACAENLPPHDSICVEHPLR